MITPELQTYIRQQLGAGITKDVIKQNLFTQGWNAQDLDEAFVSIENVQFPKAFIPPLQPIPRGHKGKWAIVIFIFLLIIAGGAFAAYHYGLFNKFLTSPTTTTLPVVTTTKPVSNTNTESENITPTTSNIICDNYECLIAAASQCQPISVTISYSGLPFPLNPDMSMSGQIKYEIQKSSGVNNCTLVFSSPVTILSISDAGRKVAIAKGTTDAQVTSLLKTMNDSAKSTAGLQSTCSSNTSTISDYLMDARDGNWKVESDGQTNTYTTSSGQKLACTDTSPKQPANTSVTITDTACATKKGVTTVITDTGTACLENQVDLGTVVGNLKINGKYPQCCVSK